MKRASSHLAAILGVSALWLAAGSPAQAFEIPVTFKSEGLYYVRVSASGPTGSSECQIAFSNRFTGCTLILRNGRHLVTAVKSANGPKWKTVIQTVKWWITVPNDPGGVDVYIPTHEVEFTYGWPAPKVYGVSSALATAFGLETRPTKHNLPDPIVQLTGSGPTRIVRMLDGCYSLVYTWPNNKSGSGITHLVMADEPLCVGGDPDHVLSVDVPAKP